MHACYEAGPTGYALYRADEAAGLRVDVVAPSKTPRAAADRVKTDRKDAELLVRLLLAGSLTAVAVPPASFEAARDLARAREQVRADLARLRHRVSKLLLRYGRVYDGGGTWTQAHSRWLAAQRFEHVPTELAYLDALAAIEGLLTRRAALDERLSLLAAEPEHWPTVSRLRCFRGIETLSALVLHLEVGDFGRFQRPGQLAAWLGLVPSVHQSGESETRGSITKTGSAFARFERLPGGDRIAAAMRAHPELIRRAGAPDTRLMQLRPRWVAKGGAEGLLCAADGQGMGVALKAEDGSWRPLAPALAAFLEGPEELAVVEVENSRGERVGEVVAGL
ncbi:MAG: IS110 family transposase [Gaiellaceae bacterium]